MIIPNGAAPQPSLNGPGKSDRMMKVKQEEREKMEGEKVRR